MDWSRSSGERPIANEQTRYPRLAGSRNEKTVGRNLYLMSFPAFLNGLFESGRVQVAPPHCPLSTAELDAADAIIHEQQAALRLNFPGKPPAWCAAAARWAGVSCYRACQLAVYRDLDAGAVDELLGQACPTAEPASRHWSVDAVFRFLPDLVRHASAASLGDPLVARLRHWAAQWPLSSVGMPDVTPQHEDEIASHAGLVQLYVDRILAKKDWSRLRHPVVRAAASRSLGGHGRLFPDAAERLTAPASPGSST